MPATPSAGDSVDDEGPHEVEVLLVDTDTQYLIDLLNQVDRDTDDVRISTSRDVDETIARIEDGEVDCIVCTYDAGHPEGLSLLEYLRKHNVTIPVVLLPTRETTIIDSRNLVADVNSVFMRDDAVDPDVLGPHLVNVVEQQRAAAAADRQTALKDLMGGITRDIAAAETPEAVDAAVCDRLEDASVFDDGWIAALDDDDDDDLAVQASTGHRVADLPGCDADGPSESLVATAHRALERDDPQLVTHDEYTYSVVPAETSEGVDRTVAVATDSTHAFQEGERTLLAELGETLSRRLESIATRQALESRVDDLELVEDLIQQVGVGVVVYGGDGLVERANETFADIVGLDREALPGTAIWNLLPPRDPDTFDTYWNTLDAAETAMETTELDGASWQLVTTRIEADGTPYNTTLVVDPADDTPFDEEFAELLSYEFRHWLDLAQEAVDEARAERDPERLQLVDEIVDRMSDAIQTEVETAGRADSAVELEPVVLGEVAGTAWNHVLGEAGTHEVKGSREVLAHEGLLLRLFEHLFRTLLHYADESTTIDVGLSGTGFYVEDANVATPHMDRAYAGGWRESPSDTGGGAGILIAERAAERMGWSLSVTENDAGGTRFTVDGVRYVAGGDDG